MGARPCHLALDRERKHLLVANCGGGSVACCRWPPTASWARPPTSGSTRQERASQRQQGPHPQGVAFSPDNRFAFVCDLGLDKVMAYRFDAAPASWRRTSRRSCR